MHNFARLVRFCWPYRGRFFVSLGCAIIVAMLWFAELGAVYPLLNILFNNGNCQNWIANQIDDKETESLALKARLEQIAEVRRNLAARPAVEGKAAPDPVVPQSYVDEVQQRFRKAEIAYADLPKELRTAPGGVFGRPISPEERPRVLALHREFRVADDSQDELFRAVQFVERGQLGALATRADKLGKQLAKANTWRDRAAWARPWIDRYLPKDGFHTLLLLMGLVMLGVALKGFFMFWQEFNVANIMQLALFDIRKVFFRRTMALDLGRFNEQGSADLLARFTSDMDSVAQGLVVLLSKVVREPLRILACLGGAMWLNWRLTLLALVLVPVSAITTVHVGKRMKRAIRKSLESMSNIYKILQQTFQGIKLVKAYTMERHERARFYRESKDLYRKRIRVATIEAMSDPVLELLAFSTVCIALLAGSFLVLRTQTEIRFGPVGLQLAAEPMTIEQLLTLYAMLAGIADPLRKLSTVHSKIQRAAAASDRICSLMDREPIVVDRAGAEPLSRHGFSVEFEDVSFSYDGRKPALRGVNLKVAHGETIALVGPNGCGKSTLMNLLPRFWDVQGGAIRIDGRDVRDVTSRSLRAQVAIVIQETILFEDTIAANIAYGSPFSSREQIEEAACRAYAHGFIESMPQGYDTVLGERGAGLSGGQRQRIALARAMLRDPAILILDEATSAVDIQDEALIRKAIEEFAKGRTTFIITHNLGSLEFADRIVLMNEGKIEAVGTDAELGRTSSLYRKLNEIHYRRESA